VDFLASDIPESSDLFAFLSALATLKTHAQHAWNTEKYIFS